MRQRAHWKYLGFIYIVCSPHSRRTPMKKSLLALSLGLGLLAGTVHADEKATQNVSIVISSPSTMPQRIAMTLGNQMQEQGAPVDILRCDDAGDLGLKDARGE